MCTMSEPMYWPTEIRVTISIRHGMAEVLEKTDGVEVIILDYDHGDPEFRPSKSVWDTDELVITESEPKGDRQ